MTVSWRLDDGRQTLVLTSRDAGLPEVIYWASALPTEVDLNVLADAQRIDVAGGMLDENPDFSICPETSRSFPGHPGLRVRTAAGEPRHPSFILVGVEHATERFFATFRDDAIGLTYQATIAIDAETSVLVAQATIESETPIRLDWLAAPVLPGAQSSDTMVDFSGRWCGEFQLNEIPWSPGMRCRENQTGRTSHEHFPALFVQGRGATNTQGDVWAFHYAWSGGHRMIAEELPDGRRQIQWGHTAGSETELATRFETAPLYLVYSNAGMNGAAVAFQRHVRDRIIRFPNPHRPRPVHYNCWEAVYFNHEFDVLKDIADRAAALGAERFVLDDGWFGVRDDDTSSLGDWRVDARKHPEGLTPLIEHVRGLDMTFGLWFEPEMISPDSDLYRRRPHWVLGPANQVRGRRQLALNVDLAEVRDYLFDEISTILSGHEIDYVKWDHNRVLPAPDARQTRGFYALVDRLVDAFPAVEFETCASGGARADFGVLSRMPRVWLSDSNDALERLRIQHDAALLLPAISTGSHVGPRQCHTSGRTLGMSFRAWVAAQRHLGFEMDPRELSDGEAKILRRVTDWWKRNRSWMSTADLLRLDVADPGMIAEQHLARDETRFVVFAGKAETSTQIAPRPLRLTRLQADQRYRVDLVNRDEASPLSRGSPLLKSEPFEAPGAWLMNHGLDLPWSFPETMWVIEGDRL